MKPKEICKRYILFIISLLFSGIGVAFTKTGALGVSPISSLANGTSIRFPVLSIGFVHRRMADCGKLCADCQRFCAVHG